MNTHLHDLPDSLYSQQLSSHDQPSVRMVLNSSSSSSSS